MFLITVLQRKRVWVNMLRMLPGISEARANAFVQKYSCPKKFMTSFHVNEKDDIMSSLDRQLQFQYDFTDIDKSDGIKRKQSSQKKLSQLVYKLAMSVNPEDVIGEDDS
jgi:hypothetical protein